MKFFDCWKTLNECFDESNLTALTQLVGYKLFAVANELKFPDSFLLTDRELMSRTNIKSGQTIVEARRQLKNAGLIDFETKKAQPTRYRFTINQATIKQESSKIQASGKQDSSKIENSYIRAREDVKTLDLRHSFNQSVDAQARDTSELDSILEYWDELKGGRLTFEHQSALNALLKEKSADWVKSAMKEAADANSNPRGLSPKFLFAVIKRKAQPLKGGDKNARQFDYDEEPDTSWIKPYR